MGVFPRVFFRGFQGFLFLFALLDGGGVRIIEMVFVVFWCVCVLWEEIYSEIWLKYGKWVLKGWFFIR